MALTPSLQLIFLPSLYVRGLVTIGTSTILIPIFNILAVISASKSNFAEFIY